MKHRKRLFLVVGNILGLLAAWAVIAWGLLQREAGLPLQLQPEPTALEAQVAAMRIRKTDLPSTDWKAYDPTPEDYPNALIAMEYTYNHHDAFWIKVNQHVVIYPSAVEAQTRYQQEFQRMLGWGPSPVVAFSGHADRMSIHCAKFIVDNIPHDSCEFFGVYENTFVILWASVFNEQWFVMDDFINLLTVMDERIIAALDQEAP